MSGTQPPYNQQRIILFGSSVRAAAESARRGGFGVVGIDLFGDTDTRRACDQFFLIADSGSGDQPELDRVLDDCAGLPMLMVGGFSQPQAWIDRLSTVCPQLGPSASIRSQLLDPRVLGELAASAAMGFPPTKTGGDTASRQAEPDNGRWLLKQPASSGGLAVRWQTDGSEQPAQSVLQRWVPGRCYGATFLSDGTRARLLGVCRALFTRKGRLPFVYAGSLGPLAVPDSLTHRLNRLGQATVNSLRLSGLFNADVIVDAAGNPWLLEINARWSSSSELIERSLADRSSGGDRPSLLAQAIGGRLLNLAAKAGKVIYLKRIIYARQQQRFRLGDLSNYIDANQSLHDLPADGSLIRPGEPVLTVVSRIERGDKTAIQSYRALRRRIASSSVYSPRSSA